MTIPYQIWWTLLMFAVICTGYSWFIRDRNNYTDAIAGVLATIFWFVSGYAMLIGVQAENISFVAPWMFWIFISIGVVTGILTFVKILDVISERNNEPHVKLGRIGL